MYSFAALFHAHHRPNSKEVWHSLKSKIEGHFSNGIRIYDNHNMIVFEHPDPATGFQSHRLANGAGIVIGTIFYPKPDGQTHVESRRAPDVIGLRESREIVKSGCRILRDHYWGSFISIVHDVENKSAIIYRSPGASLPCFCFERNGVYLIFSSPEIFEVVGKQSFEIDWDFTALLAKRQHFYHQRTGILGVDRLRSAQCLIINDETHEYKWFWDPLKVAQNADLTEPSKASMAMRLAAFDCTEAWSTVHPKPLISLSGGFDSSLVVGLTSRFLNPSNICCVTWFNNSPLLDERAYARATTRQFGVELIEYKLRLEQFSNYDAYDNIEYSPLPFSLNYDMERSPFLSKILKERELSAVYYGNGGDGLFFNLANNLSLIDYLHRRGWRRELLSVALSSAQISQTSLIRSFWAALRAWAGYYSDNDSLPPEHGWGLCPEIANSFSQEEEFLAPWELSHPLIPHGKRTQIWGIMGESLYMNLIKGVTPLPVVDLFLAQPLVEVSLRIPTYVLQYNGRERGLARQAFKDCLTPEVRLRRFKSHLTDYLNEYIRARSPVLKEYLLDGLLAQKGLLNRTKIEGFFAEPAAASEYHFVRIGQLVDTEAWARRWS
ncbi:asparagine synthase-related protein [Pedomonas sp. V897]|jgi:Asparagine synthase (glutamine-hydrolyzing)|uniref:asparagine synthase-related protein n=1 Tax=Pedomonas sp. V897 TaxID=3446482 RepID=UPI003EDEB2A3